MKSRKLINGEEAEELDSAITLIIYTRSPEKYKLIDMETGEEYIGCKNGNPTYHKVILDKIKSNHVGQWTKTKASQSES